MKFFAEFSGRIYIRCGKRNNDIREELSIFSINKWKIDYCIKMIILPRNFAVYNNSYKRFRTPKAR